MIYGCIGKTRMRERACLKPAGIGSDSILELTITFKIRTVLLTRKVLLIGLMGAAENVASGVLHSTLIVTIKARNHGVFACVGV